MDQTINILSYNSTGLDQVKIDYIKELLDILDIDLLGLQEHFKAIKSVDQFFKKHFKSHETFVKAAIRDTMEGAGRPRGGLAQFCIKNKNFKKEQIVVKSWRLQAQVIHIASYRLLWINCYMPVDPQTQTLDETEIRATLSEVENIIENGKFHDLIWGGDFNYQSNRNTRYVRIMDEFLNKYGLVSVWTKFDANYTYEHNNQSSWSTIDHFMVTEHCLENCIDAAPIHFGHNRSGHSAIMLKFRVPETIQKAELKPITELKPSWRKADSEEIDDFTQTLHDKLLDLPPPDSISCTNVLCKDINHSHERDEHVINVLMKTIESTYECLPLVKKVVNNAAPQKTRKLPGWNENVEPLKRDSLFWHAIWISAGRPIGNGLHRVMKWCRNKYKYAVRLAKREANRLESLALGEAAEAGNIKLFKAMKKHLGSKKGSGGQAIPDSLEGKVAEDDIMDKFKECYEALYNSADRSAEVETVKHHIENIIQSFPAHSLAEVNRITPDIVMEAANMMKAGKSDVSGEFTSDVFHYGPRLLFEHISEIFKSFLVHGTMTLELLSCAFLPLYKGNLKDPRKFSSYRAIAGASQMLKLLEYTVLILWGDLLGTDSLQFGFKRSAGAEQASWLVYEVAMYTYQRGGMVHAACCDLRAAFDLCLFDKLFQTILDTGIPAIAVRVLIFAYQEQKGWVRLAGRNSEEFNIKNGTRQGSILSPFWFACYLNPLIKQMRDSGLGCHVAGVYIGLVLYADDIFLLAMDPHVLQKMVDLAYQFGDENGLMFSTDDDPKKSKTTCIIFRGKKRIKYPPPILLNGKELPWLDSCTHLGHTFNENLSMDNDVYRAKNSFTHRAADLRDQLYFCNPAQKMLAIDLFCCDGYGMGLWQLSSPAVESYFKSWNQEVRKCHDIPFNSHCNLVEQYFCPDLLSLRRKILSRYAGFVNKLLQSSSKEIKILASIVISDPRSITCRNIQYLNNKTGLEVLRVSKYTVRAALPFQNPEPVEPWRSSLLTTLLQLRLNKDYTLMDKKTICAMIDSLCIS